MNGKVLNLSYEVELQIGEKLSLPDSLLDSIGVGRWVVTSALPRTKTDSMLNDWQSSGLRVASTVRLSRLDCLEQSLLLGKLGTISQSDAEQVKEIWQLYIKPQF
jgi:mRNA interferase MazF